MELLAVSISHENTPISIREKVSFTKKKQAEILKELHPRNNMKIVGAARFSAKM